MLNEFVVNLIMTYSAIYGIDPLLVVSVIDVESSWRPNVVSVGGDGGLMQLNSKVYKNYTTKELLDIKTNLKLGIKHLSDARKYSKFKDHEINWIVYYNCGAVSNTFKYPGKHKYVVKVKERMEKYKAKVGEKVMIKDIYNNILDGEAVYAGVAKQLGMSKVKIDDMVITVEDERIMDYNKYWTKDAK